MNVKEDIISFAKKLDIELIGFTDPIFKDEFVENLKRRREENMLSGFEESDENTRVDVEKILSGVKTIISVALPYKYDEIDYSKPYVSKYTMGIDYHTILLNKLKTISEYIENTYNEKCRIFCDTGVLPDREIARKAGLGFQGKNTNIITKKYGSFVFLGEILTTLYVERDKEINISCGKCKRCIEACPVSAIKECGIDGKKCLSYVSQKKEDLTEEEMEKMELRIFGCDICQDVCPFNKKVNKSNISEFYPNENIKNINIEEILSISNKEFKKKYGEFALSWRGKYIIQRNAIISVGNSNDKKYIPILEKSINTPEKLKNYIEYSLIKLKKEDNI